MQKYPQIKDRVQAKDWQGALELGGQTVADAAMFYGAGKHAASELVHARGAYVEGKVRGAAKEASRQAKSEAEKPHSSAPTSPLGLNLETFLDRERAGQAQPNGLSTSIPEKQHANAPEQSQQQSAPQSEAGGATQPVAPGGAQRGGGTPEPHTAEASLKAASNATESVDTIRGSSTIPLSEQGRQEARDLAQRTAVQFTRIYAGPRDRAQETAHAIAQANPQAGTVQTTEAIEPWFLGQHEGQPTEQVLADTHDRIRNRPDEPVPGRGQQSTGDGESFNDWKQPFIQHVQQEVANYTPGEKVLNVTHGRNVQLVRAWAATGTPDSSIHTGVMTSKFLTEPGQMLRLDPETGKVENVDDASKPGIYFARHGSTEWNGENRNAGGPNGAS